jgi:uncharacterized membrane protein
MARPDRYWLRGLTLTLGLYVILRAIASLQIVIGVWLIIFGFSEVLRYARERDWRDERRHGHH